MILAIIALALLAWFWLGAGKAANARLSCLDDTKPEEYLCVQDTKECPDSFKQAWTRPWGCDEYGDDFRCCVKEPEKKAKGPGPGDDTPEPPELTLHLYRVTLEDELKKNVEIDELMELADGSLQSVLVGIEEFFMVELEVENCKQSECDESDMEFSFSLETDAGENVLYDVTGRLVVTGKKKVDDFKVMSAKEYESMRVIKREREIDDETFFTDRTFFVDFSDRYLNEEVTFRARVTYSYEEGKAGKKQPRTISDDIRVTFRIIPAVRFGGLTQNWERSKVITAICEDPVTCSNIYYKVLRAPSLAAGPPPPTTCVAPTPDEIKNAVELEDLRKYCIIDEAGNSHGCYNSNEDCVNIGLNNLKDKKFSNALEVFLENIEKLTGDDVIPDEVVVPFQQNSNRVSVRQCVPDVLREGADSGYDRLLIAQKPDLNRDRWTFTLDMPYMGDQHLCVYGQSKTDETRVYVASEDAGRIKVDRNPPRGIIKFHPFSLNIDLICEDNESGCDDYVGLAYVSQLDDFFSALFKTKKPQSAAVHCPAYERGVAYRPETRQQIKYTDGAVRVLCMRVVDRAGNVGVAMTTVYNSYDLLAAALAAAVNDGTNNAGALIG